MVNVMNNTYNPAVIMACVIGLGLRALALAGARALGAALRMAGAFAVRHGRIIGFCLLPLAAVIAVNVAAPVVLPLLVAAAGKAAAGVGGMALVAVTSLR